MCLCKIKPCLYLIIFVISTLLFVQLLTGKSMKWLQTYDKVLNVLNLHNSLFTKGEDLDASSIRRSFFHKKNISSSKMEQDQQSVTQNADFKCSLWKFPQNWKFSVKPKIVLDPDKFLYPGIIWGPNNQIVGLKQSIYLAIKLNRTLAIPFFTSHSTSERGERTISPYQIIDVERLCRFVSCISISDLRETCNGAFDVALQAMASNSWDIRRYEHDTGMDIVKIKKKLASVPGSKPLQLLQNIGHVDIPALPNTNAWMTFKIWLSPDISSILKAYNTSARCAIYTSPFKGINTTLRNDVALPLNNSMTNITTIPDDVLYSAVTDAVRHPPCIVEAANSYVKDVLNGEQYVAVHWRYDKGDWKLTCPVKTNTAYRKQICRNVFNIQPKDLALGIASSLTFRNVERNNTFVYIATPPSLNTFKEETFVELESLDNALTKPSVLLSQYVDKHYKSCWVSSGWLQPREVVSMVEMEIMRLSSWLFYSDFSTWSVNVIPLRSERTGNGKIKLKFTKAVYQVAYAQMKLH